MTLPFRVTENDYVPDANLLVPVGNHTETVTRF
jgi:hypothetical protein